MSCYTSLEWGLSHSGIQSMYKKYIGRATLTFCQWNQGITPLVVWRLATIASSTVGKACGRRETIVK